MAATIDRFELARDNGNRVSKGWRITRYSFGMLTMQHLRTGRSSTGVVDDFGGIIYPENNIHTWRMETEELAPYYK